MNIPFRKTGPKLWLNPWLHLLLIFTIFFLFSCRTQKQVQYLQGSFDTVALSQINIPEPVIQKGDLIGITVYSDNPAATMIFNQQMSNNPSSTTFTPGAALSSSIGSGSQIMPGYLVDNQGNIQMQNLGSVHVDGLNKTQLSALLQEKLLKFLKNPYCTIRFLNYKVTVLGEVLRQGVYTIPGEKVNILEALGMAGDLTLYGLKDSIMVIREINGRRTFGTLDVSNPQLLLSPYYYLQQNDIVIVKANPKKPTVSDQTVTRNLAMVATLATIVTSLGVLLNIFLR
jgi:polysaccharide biosynthesis/export protein